MNDISQFDALDMMADMYQAWCRDQDLPCVSADEHNTEMLTVEQVTFLDTFCQMWDAIDDDNGKAYHEVIFKVDIDPQDEPKSSGLITIEDYRGWDDD